LAFLRNAAVNWLNLHYGIHALAQYGGGAFFGVFLLKAGVPAPAVLAALALLLAGRFCVRPLILPVGRRWGIKPLLIAGTLLSAVQYLIIGRVHGVDLALLELCVVGALSDAIYWTSYHAFFAALGDREHRGHQIGAREALVALVGVAAPLLTGWALVAFGPAVAFGATAGSLVLSAVPLLLAPNVPVTDRAPGALRGAVGGLAMFVADGWISAGLNLVWPIALFQSLGQSFTAFGGAMALAALAGAVSGLMLGRVIDRGGGPRAAWLAAGAMALVLILRAAGVGHPLLAVIGNAAGALVPAFYVPTLMTAMYNQSKASPCPLRFHIACEGGWDAGAAMGCLTAAALLWARAPIAWAILLALAGTAGALMLLRRYYGRLTTNPFAGS
jgi:hypothetical protein